MSSMRPYHSCRFTIENVIQFDKAVYTQNRQLFVFDSIDALKSELAGYFNTI